MSRPYLVIEYVGERKLGKCYSALDWKFTSTYPLKPERVKDLVRASGIDGNAGLEILNGGTDPIREPGLETYYVSHVSVLVDSSG